MAVESQPALKRSVPTRGPKPELRSMPDGRHKRHRRSRSPIDVPFATNLIFSSDQLQTSLPGSSCITSNVGIYICYRYLVLDMDVLARAGLVDLNEDVSGYANPHRSPNLSSWPSPPLFLRRSPIPTSPDISIPSPSTPSPQIPENLINRALPPELLLSIFSFLTSDISDHGAN